VHKATIRFWSCFNQLPQSTQNLAKKNYALLKKNPKHSSLHFKKAGKLWSARVGKNYRALAMKDNEGFIWVWIGNHAEYERLLNK
jgi:hypothetical protein